MTDTTDNLVIAATINNPQFQDRCRLRFLSAAISVMNEVLSIATSAPTAAGGTVLHFASAAGAAQGMGVSNLFTPNSIPVGTIVEGVTGTAVTLNNVVVGGTGVLTGDVIQIAAISHVQRAAFAGALFRGTVDLKMLAMVVLASTINRTDCLANPNVPGGNVTDANIDTQIATVLTGIATSSSW